MRRHHFLPLICSILVATLGISPLSFSQEDSWKRVAPGDQASTILFPGDPDHAVRKVETPVGILDYNRYQVKDMYGNALYMLSYCDYPPGYFGRDSTALVQAFFDTTVESSVEAVAGTLLYRDAIEQAGFPGVIWKFKYHEGLLAVKNKAYLAGDRFYHLQVITGIQADRNPAIDTFLDSFRFIE